VPGVQLDLANAAALVESAHLHAYLAAAEIDQNAHDGVYPSMVGRAEGADGHRRRGQVRAGGHPAAAGRVRRGQLRHRQPDAADLAHLEAASSHTIFRPEINAQLYGQHLLGIEGGVTPII